MEKETDDNSKDSKLNNDDNDIDAYNKDDKSEATEEMKLEEKDKENKNIKKKKKIIEICEETEEDKLIKEIIGLNKFSTSKGKSHKDSDASAVFLGRKAKRIYQRFMNYKPFSKILKQAYMSLNPEF